MSFFFVISIFVIVNFSGSKNENTVCMSLPLTPILPPSGQTFREGQKSTPPTRLLLMKTPLVPFLVRPACDPARDPRAVRENNFHTHKPLRALVYAAFETDFSNAEVENIPPVCLLKQG